MKPFSIVIYIHVGGVDEEFQYLGGKTLNKVSASHSFLVSPDMSLATMVMDFPRGWLEVLGHNGIGARMNDDA